MLMISLLIIISGWFTNLVSGIRTPSPTSPKLNMSLSPVFFSRLAIREEDIYTDIKTYNSTHSHKLPLIHEYLEDYENTTLKKGHRHVEEHPMLVYRMVGRFVHYITPLLLHLNGSKVKSERELFKKLEEREDVYYPNITDHLLAVARNVILIQHVCDIPAADIISGRFRGIETGIGLTPPQTLEYANFSNRLTSYYTGIDFLDQPGLDYNENATKLKDRVRAEIIHSHDSAFDEKIELGDLYMFQKPISHGPTKPLKLVEYEEWVEYGQQSNQPREYRLKVFGLCSHRRPNKLTNLKCWNDHISHPYNTIAPVQTELLSESPQFFLFHNVLGDKAIQTLEEAYLPQLEKEVVAPSNPTDSVSYAWLPNEILKTPIVPKFEEIFKLAVKGNASDFFRYTLYHVGGDGIHHHDSYKPPNINGTVTFADRISSFLFYTRDVEMGGETVFPYIDLVVKPEKGAVLYWYNYDKTGVVDWRTLHGICPPILGVKTYISCFIGSTPNMFHHKCGLTASDKYKFL